MDLGRLLAFGSDRLMSPATTAKRGDYVAVRLSGHDGRPAAYVIRRVVRATRAGKVTHVCDESEWRRAYARAGGGTDLRGQGVEQVYTVAEYASDPRLGELANAGFWVGGSRSISDLVTRIHEIEEVTA